MVMICVHSTLYYPPSILHISITPLPNIYPNEIPQNLSAVFKIRLGIFGYPLRGLDVRQIEVGFLYLVWRWRGVFKRQSSSLSQRPAQSPSRHPHPLVTERGGDPVNYRRVPHSEQWCIHSAFTTTSAFLHRPRHNLSDRFSYTSEPSGDKHIDI